METNGPASLVYGIVNSALSTVANTSVHLFSGGLVDELLLLLLLIRQHVQHEIIKYSTDKNTVYNAKHKLISSLYCPLNAHQTADLIAYIPDFVVNWVKVRAARRPQIWKFIGVTTISEIIACREC